MVGIERLRSVVGNLVALGLAVATGGAVLPAGAEDHRDPERLVGVLARSHGELGFAPCGGEARIAVDATTGGTLAAQLDWLLDGRDGAVRIEVDAIAVDGTWRLTHLRRAGHSEPACPGNDAIDYVWRAVGEGGWALLATSRSVQVSGVEGLDGRRFRFSPFVRGPDGGYRYAAETDGGRLEVELAPGTCRSVGAEGRDAAVSDYRAVLSWRGRRWSGCAHNGFSQ
jgi:uncharacterized membrane protein